MSSILSIKTIPSTQVEIKDENGAPTGVFFELAGPTHPKRKAIQFQAQRRVQQQLQKTGKVKTDDPVEQESEARENLAAYTLGWTGLTDENGVDVPFSAAKALELYEDEEYAWLVNQLQAALWDQDRFTKRSATA